MTAGRELEGEEPGAAAGVERVQLASAAEDEVEDAVPRGALRRSQWAATCCLTTSV